MVRLDRLFQRVYHFLTCKVVRLRYSIILLTLLSLVLTPIRCNYDVTEDDGLLVLSPSILESAEVYQREMKPYFQNSTESLLLLLIHEESCEYSVQLLHQMKEAAALFDTFQTKLDSVPRTAQMTVERTNQPEWMQALHLVEAFPTLMFVVTTPNYSESNSSELLFLEYAGLKETPQEIFRTTLHYYFLLMGSEEIYREKNNVHVRPRSFGTLEHALAFVEGHPVLLEHSYVPPPLPPYYSSQEQSYIRWLMEGIDVSEFTLIIQCRSTALNIKQDEWYNVYEEMARAMAPRHDCLFVTSRDCDGVEDGTVLAYRLDASMNWSAAFSCFNSHASQQQPRLEQRKDSQALVEFLVKLMTPPVMWFDRQSTGAVAFPLYRKVHAVLFVDMHFVQEIQELHRQQTRQIVRAFSSTCRNHRRNNLLVEERDMVCLLVPSTETRVLATFGIDPWSPLHEKVVHPEKHIETDVLPSLLITDQRYVGTRRYYLDLKDILASETAISVFVSDFWEHRLRAEIKSEPRGPRTNTAGVRILTGQRLDELLTTSNAKHALVLFTNPTCGHCKRFSTLWNRAAELVQHMQWNDILNFYQVDVAANDIYPLNVTVRWVPDLFYVAPDRKAFVRFDKKDGLGDGVARLKEAIFIIYWFLTVAQLDEEVVHQLVNRLAHLG